MSTGWMVLVFFGGTFVFFLLLGLLTRGSGADVVDGDPARRAERRRAREHEDLEQLERLGLDR